MKRSITILFLSMYLLVSIGITLSVHFCGDSITSVQLIPFVSQNDLCGCDDAEIPDDCCKTEIKSIQLNDDQLSVQKDQALSTQTDIVMWPSLISDHTFAAEFIQPIVPSSSPPGSPPIYILNSQFLI